MKNYIVIEGKQIELSEETVARLKDELNVNEKLSYKDVANELFKDGGYYTDSIGIDNSISIKTTDLNNSTTREQLEAILELNKLANVAKYLNKDWLPDWRDTNEFKYHHYNEFNTSVKISYNQSRNQSKVYFKTKELAEQAIEILGEDSINKALTLNY